MLFTERLYNHALTIWEGCMNHPFVKGIGEGNLDVDKFKFYLIQDYLYLSDYAKVFAIGVMKTNELELVSKLSATQNSILNTEMGLHRNYMQTFGITDSDVKEIKPSCTNVSYTKYMLSEAQAGSLGDVIAAVLPCMWGYLEIGKHVAKTYAKVAHNPYQDWINMYSSEAYEKDTHYYIDLMNQIADGRSEADLSHMEEIFMNTSRFEYLFWEMAYKQESWNTPA